MKGGGEEWKEDERNGRRRRGMEGGGEEWKEEGRNGRRRGWNGKRRGRKGRSSTFVNGCR